MPISAYSAVATKRRDDLWSIWKTLHLPWAQVRETSEYQKDFKQAHTAFLKGFDDMATDLNELTKIRMGKSSAT